METMKRVLLEWQFWMTQLKGSLIHDLKIFWDNTFISRKIALLKSRIRSVHSEDRLQVKALYKWTFVLYFNPITGGADHSWWTAQKSCEVQGVEFQQHSVENSCKECSAAAKWRWLNVVKQMKSKGGGGALWYSSPPPPTHPPSSSSEIGISTITMK